MPDRPRFSRFRRLPGLYRFGDDKPPDLDAEPQLLAMYLPAGLLDRAERLSMLAGAESVQEFCKTVLRQAIEELEERQRSETESARQGTLESLDELASDPDYLVEWSASGRTQAVEPPELKLSPRDLNSEDELDARGVVLKHAAMRTPMDSEGLLERLRRGETIGQDTRDELTSALAMLESSLSGHVHLDRNLAYALHRLAFEGQILITERDLASAGDPVTVETLRRVQEGVGRILSGQDIRYFLEPSPPAEDPGISRP